MPNTFSDITKVIKYYGKYNNIPLNKIMLRNKKRTAEFLPRYASTEVSLSYRQGFIPKSDENTLFFAGIGKFGRILITKS